MISARNDVSVLNGDANLSSDPKPPCLELVSKYDFVYTLEKAGAQLAVHLNSRLDHKSPYLVFNHSLRLRVSARDLFMLPTL